MNSTASRKWSFLFFALLLGISFAYNYQHILFLRPYSVHQWRQCDCLSIAYNYYKEGMHFFRPVTHWCGPNGDGKVSTSECPLIYYGVACLWKIFGYHEFIYRLVTIAISFTGLFFLYKLAYELLSDHLLAIMVSLFLFASPIFAFYTNNFLVDVPALCFAIIGWYFFVRFLKTPVNKLFYISILFFMLAGITKLSSLIAFAPILILVGLELFGMKLNKGNKIFASPLKMTVPIALAFAIIALWTLYVLRYNSHLDIRVFSTQMFPIWQFDFSQCKNLLHSFYHDLLPQFYNASMLIIIAALFIALIVLHKKINSLFLFTTLCIAVCIVIYFLLWFQVFDVHDYYMINILVIVPCVLITFLHYLKKNHASFFASATLKIMLGLLLGLNIYYTAVRTSCKYPKSDGSKITEGFMVDKSTADLWNWFHWNYGVYMKAYETIESYNRSIGIKREDKVVSIPDNSVNISLYLMDQKGFDDYYYPTMEDLPRLEQYILLGAKYLFVNDSNLLQAYWIKPYITHPIGRYKNIQIYNLQSPEIIPQMLSNTKQYITKDSNWIRDIRVKAAEKKISVDSMLTLDAIWTLKTAKK